MGAESGQQQYSRPITRNVLTDDLRWRRCSSSIELAADHVVLVKINRFVQLIYLLWLRANEAALV